MNNNFFPRFLLLGAIVFIIFYNSFENDFAFDDHLGIVNNPDIARNVPFIDVWRHDIWGKSLLAVDSHRSYRPMLIIIFKLFANKFGVEPIPLRILSVASHFVVTILYYFTAAIVFDCSALGFSSALFFACHPVHVESVIAVINAAEPLCALCYLLCFLLYYNATRKRRPTETLKGYLNQGSDPIAADFEQNRFVAIFIFSVLAWVNLSPAATLLKETGVTISGVIIAHSGVVLLKEMIGCIVYYFMLCTKAERGSELWMRLCDRISVLKWWVFRHFIWCLLAIGTCLWYLLLRKLIAERDPVEFVSDIWRNGILSSHSQRSIYSIVFTSEDENNLFLGRSDLIRKAENPFAFLSGNSKLFSLMYLHFRYFYLLLWPAELCSEYAFNCIPAIENLFDPRFIYTMIFYSGVVIAIYQGIEYLLTSAISIAEKEDGVSQNIGKDVDFTDPRASSSCFDVDNSPHAISSNHADSATNDIRSDENQDRVHDLVGNLDSIRPWDITRVTIKAESNLIALAFLIVPFIPVSGVFLRLGTLLAERLLYLPSMGYCMLLSLFLYKFSVVTTGLMGIRPDIRDISRMSSEERDLNDRRRKKSCFLANSLFWFSTAVIVILYSYRTIIRNPAWKDDKTLFLDSLNVCSNSAKLQLQVAKLRLNEGNTTGARAHVDAARRIDPSFCDIGYQEALLRIAEDNDYEGAIKAAAENLKCIFTSMHSWELLSKIWEQKIAMRPNDPSLLEEIADITANASLTFVAIRKYCQAANLAFELKKYSYAIDLTLKGEELLRRELKLVPRGNSTGKGGVDERSVAKVEDYVGISSSIAKSNPEEGDRLAIISCQLASTSGIIRDSLRTLKQNDKGSRALKKLNQHLSSSLIEQYLIQAVSTSCASVDPETNDVSIHSILALHALFKAYEEKFRKLQIEPSTIEVTRLSKSNSRDGDPEKKALESAVFVSSFASFCDKSEEALTAMMSVFLAIPSVKFKGRQRPITSNVLKDQLKVVTQNSILLWTTAGQTYFSLKNYRNASDAFSRILNNPKVVASKSVPCSVYFWYAHALAGLETFIRDRGMIQRSIDMLSAGMACNDSTVGPLMKQEAADNIEDLRDFLMEYFV